MHVLVTGATGFVGRWVVAALLKRGDRVRGMGRNETACGILESEGAEVVRADLRDRPAVVAACAGVDAVLHVGALSAPWGPAAEFHSVNVGGTEHVLAGCREYRVGRLVYVSSPSVFFDGRDHHDLTDDAPYPRRLMSVYSTTKKIAEDRIRAAAAEGLATVTLRPKAVFGPGDTSLLPRLLRAAERRRLPQIGDGRNRVDLTYVENVADALLLALESKAAVGKTYTITNGEHVLLWDLIRQVLRGLGLDDDLRRLPYPFVYVLAALSEARAALFGGEPLLTRYTTALLARPQTYNIDAARRDLGYSPRVSIAEGVERTLKSLRVEPFHAPAPPAGRADAAVSRP
jgi:nucleoside-diphosphate-sugar epimerase